MTVNIKIPVVWTVTPSVLLAFKLCGITSQKTVIFILCSIETYYTKILLSYS
jgi:hypothetical protein